MTLFNKSDSKHSLRLLMTLFFTSDTFQKLSLCTNDTFCYKHFSKSVIKPLIEMRCMRFQQLCIKPSGFLVELSSTTWIHARKFSMPAVHKRVCLELTGERKALSTTAYMVLCIVLIFMLH